MEIQFRRTSERQYAIIVHRPNLAPLEFQGPGYDPIMPHDLAHMIVESELGLTHGIFGFMAAGGDTGGAPHLAPGERRREAARRRSRAARRDERMLRNGSRAEGPLSERAAYVCLYEWLRRSSDPQRRKRATELTAGTNPRSGLSDGEKQLLSDDVVARICARMDDLSTRWAKLDVGESFSVEWSPRSANRRRKSTI